MITPELVDSGTNTQNTQNIQKTIVTPVIKNKTKFSKKVLEDLIFIIIGIACILAWYFYRPQIISFWNKGVESSQVLSVSSWNSLKKVSIGSWNSLQKVSVNSWNSLQEMFINSWNSLTRGMESSRKLSVHSWNSLQGAFVNSWNSLVNNFKKLSMPSLPSFKLPSFSFKFPSFDFWKIFSTNKAPNSPNVPVRQQNNPIIKPIIKAVKDCGIGPTPDLKDPKTYQNNTVLNCLGNSVLRCEEAKAVLKDALFPTIFQVVQNKNNGQNADQNTCRFKLSYAEDSTLMDATGRKLAGQYILCPVGIVKVLDESNPKSPVFKAPSKDNLSKYASQIYFYGTLGLFIENNLEKNKIQNLGCSGSYIDSIIASYQKMGAQR